MGTPLFSIQSLVQQAAEAISVALRLEVTVIDNSLRVVAATGRLYEELGKFYGEGSLTRHSLMENKPHVVRDNKSYPLCRNCQRYSSCPHSSVILFPITLKDKAIGSIGLTAITSEERRALLSRERELLTFLANISPLFGIAAVSVAPDRQKFDTGKLLETIVNIGHDGVIVIDSEGSVIYFNQLANEFLGLSNGLSIGTPIRSVFPNIDVLRLMRDSSTKEIALTASIGCKARAFMGTVTPIREQGRITCAVVKFRRALDPPKVLGPLSRKANTTQEEIIGKSAFVVELKEKIKKIAAIDATVLVQGETGTGKELVARVIHNTSPRQRGAFVAINCAAIPETLLESELFGYEKGAFTGAKYEGKPGKIELAQKGTLFLDEIGDMPPHLQAKLLRVLEQKQIERLGGIESIYVDTRIIAATSSNLEEMIERGKFREDLYYRLNVITINIPPLRERREDIKPLLYHFLSIFNLKYDKNIKGFTPSAEERLLAYDWPGNVRELQNTVEHAVIMEPSDAIHDQSLPPRIMMYSQRGQQVEPYLKTLERKAILDALKQFGTSTSGKEKAARHLGIGRSTLYNKLKEIKDLGLMD